MALAPTDPIAASTAAVLLSPSVQLSTTRVRSSAGGRCVVGFWPRLAVLCCAVLCRAVGETAGVAVWVEEGPGSLLAVATDGAAAGGCRWV